MLGALLSVIALLGLIDLLGVILLLGLIDLLGVILLLGLIDLLGVILLLGLIDLLGVIAVHGTFLGVVGVMRVLIDTTVLNVLLNNISIAADVNVAGHKTWSHRAKLSEIRGTEMKRWWEPPRAECKYGEEENRPTSLTTTVESNDEYYSSLNKHRNLTTTVKSNDEYYYSLNQHRNTYINCSASA